MDGATRTVYVWLSNDEPMYAETNRLARVAIDTRDFADNLKAWIADLVRDPEPGLRADLINGALAEVDWRELATTWTGDDDED